MSLFSFKLGNEASWVFSKMVGILSIIAVIASRTIVLAILSVLFLEPLHLTEIDHKYVYGLLLTACFNQYIYNPLPNRRQDDESELDGDTDEEVLKYIIKGILMNLFVVPVCVLAIGYAVRFYML